MAEEVKSAIRITGIDLHAYFAKDAKRAIAFYRDVLGMVPDEETEVGAEFTLADGSTFGIWDPQGSMPWEKGTGVMFAVEDIDAAVAAGRAKGVPFGDVIDTRICRMSLGQDSEGNEIILHKRKHGL